MKRKAELQGESIHRTLKLKCLKVEEEYEVENVKMQTLLEMMNQTLNRAFPNRKFTNEQEGKEFDLKSK